MTAEQLAEVFHTTYERLAPDYGIAWSIHGHTVEPTSMIACRLIVIAIQQGAFVEPGELFQRVTIMDC